jgi:ABC-2 type transport system ATP-binding protein
MERDTALGPAIDAGGLTKTYRGDIKALDGVNVLVEQGRIFGLLGSNGAGKSTVIRILITLTRPDRGTARVAGYDVSSESARVRAAVGVVGQKNGADLDATGWENLMLQGHLHGMRGRALRDRAAELLDRFGLGSAARRVVKGYSGGMQRRLDIAMGLIHRPAVLFLDEPTTGLDPEMRTALWQEIGRLNSEDKLTIVLTTHYLEEADQLADQLAIIDHGRVIAEGSPEELKNGIRGDSIHVELAGPSADDAVIPALSRVDGCHDVTVAGSWARASVMNGAKAIPDVLTALEGRGIRALSVSVTRPTLDDVFLRVTGKSLSQAQLAPTTQGPR